MRIVEFSNSSLNSVNIWRASRGMMPIAAIDMPTRCFMIPGVAVAGLRHVEGNVVIMDSFITNPWVSASTRNKAADQLFEHVIAFAGDKRILGFTTDNNTLERAIKHGFVPSPYTLLSYSKGQ